MSRSKHIIDSILIANRGEIACRIMRTAKKMNIRVVSVYSDIDSNALHVKMADEAYRLHGQTSIDTYLNQNKILEIADKSKCKAIHPGYGFLSENVEFAKACESNNLIFIGPSSEAIRKMGIKSTSKEIMTQANVPVIPGYHGSNQDVEILKENADKIGYPLMIKAVRGGGGKGMRIVNEASNFLSQLKSAQRESQCSFNDCKVLLEKYIATSRHIEVQIIGDEYGNYVYLYERDCSVQRRHQKIIEEAPAPGISTEFRHRLGENAVKVAKAVQYKNAGTVEFILDQATNEFYFMEMNTRLQVEHPISEMITGIDLVQWQILVASGENLPLIQAEIPCKGHSFEARIYAENPYDSFLPGAGNITHLKTPDSGDNIRIETGVVEGDHVSFHYDPMISKLIVWDETRDTALSRMRKSLSQYQIVGLDTNINFLIDLCKNKAFIKGNVHSGFIEQYREELLNRKQPDVQTILWIGLAIALKDIESSKKQKESRSVFSMLTGFRLNHSYVRNVSFSYGIREFIVQITFEKINSFRISMSNDQSTELYVTDGALHQTSKHGFELVGNGEEQKLKCQLVMLNDSVTIFTDDGSFKFDLPEESFSVDKEDSVTVDVNNISSPMPGLVDKVLVHCGDIVKTGDPLMVIIAMKMEYVILSPIEGNIEEIFYKPGDSVKRNQILVKMSPL